MKLSKKKVLVIALAVCLVAILSMGSLAWFNASEDITNEFHMSTSEEDPDAIFSVDVWEYIDGDTTTPDYDGHTFTDIVPGATYEKEPHIENTGSYSQWIRVKVSISEGQKWIDALNGYDLSLAFGGHDETLWTRYDAPAIDATTGDLVYVFYLNDVLDPDEDVAIFDSVTIPTVLEQDDMVFEDGVFKLNIVAEAIQSQYTGTTAKAAFDNCWTY